MPPFFSHVFLISAMGVSAFLMPAALAGDNGLYSRVRPSAKATELIGEDRNGSQVLIDLSAFGTKAEGICNLLLSSSEPHAFFGSAANGTLKLESLYGENEPGGVTILTSVGNAFTFYVDDTTSDEWNGRLDSEGQVYSRAIYVHGPLPDHFETYLETLQQIDQSSSASQRAFNILGKLNYEGTSFQVEALQTNLASNLVGSSPQVFNKLTLAFGEVTQRRDGRIYLYTPAGHPLEIRFEYSKPAALRTSAEQSQKSKSFNYKVFDRRKVLVQGLGSQAIDPKTGQSTEVIVVFVDDPSLTFIRHFDQRFENN